MQDDKPAAEEADNTPAPVADVQTETATTPPNRDETADAPAASADTPAQPPDAPEPAADAEATEAETVAAETAVAAETVVAETAVAATAAEEPIAPNQADQPDRRGKRDRREQDRRERPPRNDAQQREADRVMRRFHACARCSTLVSACGVALGRETVRDAAAATRDGWLTLECDTDVRRLIDNAYSVSADLLAYYLDSSCPECRRRYIFIDQTDEDKGCLLKLAL